MGELNACMRETYRFIGVAAAALARERVVSKLLIKGVRCSQFIPQWDAFTFNEGSETE